MFGIAVTGDMDQAADEWKERASGYDGNLQMALTDFGEAAVAKLQADAHAGRFGPDKKKPPGVGPPLIDSGNYISSIQAESLGSDLQIKPTGSNTYMSNEALGELLEYGSSKMPARPHFRKILRWMRSNMAREFGDPLYAQVFASGSGRGGRR